MTGVPLSFTGSGAEELRARFAMRTLSALCLPLLLECALTSACKGSHTVPAGPFTLRRIPAARREHALLRGGIKQEGLGAHRTLLLRGGCYGQNDGPGEEYDDDFFLVPPFSPCASYGMDASWCLRRSLQT